LGVSLEAIPAGAKHLMAVVENSHSGRILGITLDQAMVKL